MRCSRRRTHRPLRPAAPRQARHKRRELREQRDALERVQHVALGLGVRPREELGADASRTGLAPTAKQSPALESGAETQSAASAPPLTLRRLLEGFAVSDPSTLEPRGKAHAASPTEEADGGEERAGGAGEGGPEWITAPQIVAAVSSVTVDPAEEEAEEARTATAQESARARMFDRMSSRYVAVLLRAPKGPRRDSFLEHLPDVVAQSAFKSFFLAFPRARVRFGTVFRTQLFDLCQEWFTGASVRRGCVHARLHAARCAAHASVPFSPSPLPIFQAFGRRSRRR